MRTNLKASLAAKDVSVINEDDRDLESSSSDDGSANAGSDFKALAGGEKKLSNRAPRKVSDVYSDDYKNVNMNDNQIDARSM